MLHIVFHEPRIAGNTGNAVRLAAATGSHLHVVRPLFDFEDSKLRRAGLDYHDLAVVSVHDELDTALPEGSRVFAFTTQATRWYTDVEYAEGDVLLFGPEPTGLDEATLAHPRLTDQLRIPMLDARRSMNLANCASIAVYEAWRQQGFAGGR